MIHNYTLSRVEFLYEKRFNPNFTELHITKAIKNPWRYWLMITIPSDNRCLLAILSTFLLFSNKSAYSFFLYL
ncbi:hypothetical protein HCUR_00768 [Holospora curviuscula]|uniref:Uncharacterized protein n=1 Tax=Holospora curviuscula TaxID=1082868 RepID=A0A2S5R8Z0_9PROT|nr:hypothetical protein HCUR_00768 [Holospora curviuscula]